MSTQPPAANSAGDMTAPDTPTTALPEPVHVSSTGLESLLIRPEDLPAELVVAAEGEETRQVEICGITVPDDLASVDYSSVSYEGVRTSTYVSQYLARVDRASVSQNMAGLREAFADCDEWIQQSATGEATYTIGLLDVALPGDGVAFSAIGDFAGLGHVQTQTAIVNVGEFVTWISYTEIGDAVVPPDALVRYTDIAARRLTGG